MSDEFDVDPADLCYDECMYLCYLDPEDCKKICERDCYKKSYESDIEDDEATEG